jgi:hypothetical protein
VHGDRHGLRAGRRQRQRHGQALARSR